MGEFKMPSLGADMEAGTVYDWRVKAGDEVHRGDVIVTVETDKGAIDVEIFEDGVVSEIVVAEGTEVAVGTILAYINGKSAVSDAVSLPQKVVAAVEAPKQVAPADTHPMDQRPLVVPPDGEKAAWERRVRVSPVARRRAKELGIDLEQVRRTGPAGSISLADVERVAQQQTAATAKPRVTPVARRVAEHKGIELNAVKGTGTGGAITRSDVERTARPPQPEAAPARKKADFQTGMRRAIAAAMSRSNRDIPHYYLESRVDMSRALAWLQNENMNRSLKERLLPAVLYVKAAAKALSEVPALNGYWLEDGFQQQESIHIGFAIALRQGGLVTPAIHHADLATVDEIMATLRDLIMRTRAGRLRSSELTDPTVTLTSLGDRGVDKVYGVIYPPQVALIGLGKVVDSPWVENNMVGIRPVMTVTLAADHRASDGHTGALFLEAFNNVLQDPETMS